MHNFLNPKLIPKVVCKSPCTDNYEVDNLISNDYTTKCRGFIAYSSIKPPVDVDFDFICPVNIHYIIVNSNVGLQKCTGIELFMKNSKVSYTAVSKAHYDKSGIIFCNSRMYSREKPPCNLQDYHLAYFKSNLFKLFLNADGIRLRIFQTYKSVPCLASVEVWGRVSKMCSPTTKETVEKLYNKNVPEVTESDVTHASSCGGFNIPEDFKDDLTDELMTIPMTLPSGKTIDQSTIEKHIKNEKEFGRKPGDPFTGLKFTNNIKPVLNVALKSRIDMFLLQHENQPETFNLKRTLGRSTISVGQTSSVSYKKLKLKGDEDDLEIAIKVAQAEPSFTLFSGEDKGVIKCVRCELIEDYFYKLPCEHYYCRKCLLIICGNLKCDSCGDVFIKSDVKKINL